VLEGPGQARDLETRERYVVRAEMCGLCHTEIDPAMIYRDDHYLAGGMRVGAYPQGTFITRNLISDQNTGLGRWSEAEIATAIRDGRAKDGRLLNFWGMPWPWLHNLSLDQGRVDPDLRSRELLSAFQGTSGGTIRGGHERFFNH
jgi:hypothetical protein